MIDYPNIAPQTMKIGLASNSKSFTSNFNQSNSVVKFAGEHLILSMTYTALDFGSLFDYDEAKVMEAFLFELGGKAGTVKVPLFHRPGKPAKGNPVTSVEGQLGGMINTSGWTPNALVLKRGDYFTVSDEAKMCMADVVADPSGNATLTFAPWLRTRTETGTAIVTKDPYGIFRSTNDTNEIDLEPANGSITLEFKEAFYV